jgi:hypothetical protein
MKEEMMSKASTELKSQTPAEGILIQRDYGDAKVYTVMCECGDGNHQHNVWVEAEDIGVLITTYTQQKSKWWKLNRWQTIWILLTKGYIEYEATLIMTEQQALNYAEILKTAIKDVKQFKAKTDPLTRATSKIANEGDCV